MNYFTTFIFLTFNLLSTAALAETNSADAMLLPSEMPIYVKGFVQVSSPMPGYDKRTLPVNNQYQGTPGCYIACYGASAEHAVYSVSPLYHVHGLIRIAGHYAAGICLPYGDEVTDLSKAPFYNGLCYDLLPSCALPDSHCWAGGSTGDFVGAS